MSWKRGVEQLCGELGGRPESIWLAGNTSMEHLLMELDTRTLGRYPFYSGMPAGNVSSRKAGEGRRFGTGDPFIAGNIGFVGADITAGASGLRFCGV